MSSNAGLSQEAQHKGIQIYYPRDEKYNTGIWPEVTSIVWNVRHGQDLFNRYMQGNRFPSLRSLWIDDRGLSDLSVLQEYQGLTSLNCSGNDLTSLPDLPNLRRLICRANNLTTIPSMPFLEHLDCSLNSLTTESFPHRRGYIYLAISENQLDGRIHLDCPNLAYLDISKNQINDLSLDCPQLKDLYCYQNNLLTTSGFAACQSLRHLTCNQNPLRDLNGLENSHDLQMVYACNGLIPATPGNYLLIN